jgi:hypothetical protein
MDVQTLVRQSRCRRVSDALTPRRKCISQYDLTSAKECYDEDTLEGIDELPKDYRNAVLETFGTGEIVVPPMPEENTMKKAKKPRAPRKKKADADGEEDSVNETATPKPNSRKKRTAAKVDTASENDEPAPKKKRGGRGRGGRPAKKVVSSEEDGSAVDEPPALEQVSRAKPVPKAVDPKVAGIEALTEKLRAQASN